MLLVTDGGPNCNALLACDRAECCLNLDQQCAEWETENCCATEGTRLWCVDYAGTWAKIEALAARGIKTIVVGLPGTELYEDWLNGFAEVGEGLAPEVRFLVNGQPFPSIAAGLEKVDPASQRQLLYQVARSGGQEALNQTFADIAEDLVDHCTLQPSQTPPSWDASYVNVAIDCKVVPRASAALVDHAGNEVRVFFWFVDDSTDPPRIVFDEDNPYCQQMHQGVDRIDLLIGCPPVLYPDPSL